MTMGFDVVYTDKNLLISKRRLGWKGWQDLFESYKASLSFDTLFDLVDFLEVEYRLSTGECDLISKSLKENDFEFWQLVLVSENNGLMLFQEFKRRE